MTYTKLSAELAAAYRQFEDEGPAGLIPRMESLGLVNVEEPARPARAVVFLRCEEDAALEPLAGAGLEVNSGHGEVRTGIAPLDALAAVAADDAVQQIRAARQLRPLMDVAPAKVGLPTFRSRTGLTGTGVVVGVVDTGIDARHPAFAGRIERIWDQTLHGTGVAEGGYGVELTGARLTESRDTRGHGTHVAGIAVGADPGFPGVAPRARLVVVKTSFLDVHIADGVRYCLRVARDLGLPAVVNLSLGGHGDPHDGTDPLSQIIDAESGPGRVVCCAAGNEGGDAIHARARVRQDGRRTLSCLASGPFEVNAWYPGTDKLEVAVAGPSGTSTPFLAARTDGSPVSTYELPDGVVRIATPGPDPVNHDHQVLILVDPTGKGPAPGRTWRIRFRGRKVGSGQVDAWVLSPQRSPAVFTGRYVHDAVKVGSPGAATTAMTVAAYTTKVGWTDAGGASHEVGLDVDDIADFSSEGPRRDDHPKPDVTAPGAMIASALSRDALLDRHWTLDDSHAVLAGTSMATPFLAGVVALLLERDPALQPKAVREMIRQACSVPRRSAGTFDPQWGYGLLAANRL